MIPVAALKENNLSYIVTNVPINRITPHDTVIHEGKMMTVSRKDLKDGFMGRTLFGDSYRLGRIPVKKVTFVIV